MTNKITWLEAYTQGYAIERSRDMKNWFDLTEEPSAGDDWNYRMKASGSIYDDEHQANDYYNPDDIA